MTQASERFRVMHEDGKSYTVYYCKSGKWYFYTNSWNEKRGIMILSPSRRTSNVSAETAKAYGEAL